MTPDPLAGYAGQQARRTLLIGTACALFAAWLYGANIPAARAASQAGLPGAELIFYRSMMMVPVLGILAMVLGISLRLGPAERGAVLRLAVAAGLTATFYLSALDHLAVPLTVVIFYTFPLIVMVVSNRLEGRPISRQQVMVFVVAFAGLVLAVGPSFAELTLKGVLFALIAACACAAMFLVAGRVEGSTVRTLFWIQLVVAPISLAFMLINGGPAPLSVFLVAPISITIAMGAYAIAFVFQLMASKRISASRTSLLFLFEPVTAIVFAAWFIGETLAPLQLIGVGLILAALAGEVLLDMPAKGGAAAEPPMTGPLAPLPLVVLTGFLGAGKTTRLNRWLTDPALAETLVIINEFGAVGLDHLLVEEAPGDMVLMAAGCLCCTIRGDLVATLEDLLRRRDNHRIQPFRQVLIETTGLADPLPILQSILQHPYLSKRFSVAALVTLVDAVHGVATLEAHAEARRQVALADRLLITKAELVSTGDHARLLAALTALNPTIPVLESEPSDFASGLFAGRFEPWQRGDGDIVAWLGAAEGGSPVSAHQPSHLGEDIASFSFVTETPIEPAALIVFQEAMRVLHGPRLLRLKGIIALSDDPERPAVIHHVQSVAHPMHRLARWPGRDRRSRLVFIVQGVARETIERFWQALANPGPGGQANR